MGGKLLWTGLTIINIAPLVTVPAAAIVGAILMLLGCVLLWLDR